MPALAAHYKLGSLVYETLDDEVKSHIIRNFDMYFLGTQGPDLLFYYKPLKRNFANEEGSRYHTMSGAELFTPLLAVRDSWTESLRAYLLGVCCHYALDRNVHPYVYKHAPSTAEHQSLEAEFDRFVIDKYQMSDRRFECIPDSGIDADALQQVYEKLSPDILMESVSSFRRAFKWLRHRRFVGVAEKIFGMRGILSSLCLPDEIESPEHIKQLFEKYQMALTAAPQLMNVLLHGDECALRGSMNNNFKGAVL